MKKTLVMAIIVTMLCSTFSFDVFAQDSSQYSYLVVWVREDIRPGGYFQEDMLLAYKTYQEGNRNISKTGFIDKTGKEVIPFIYDGAEYFSNGLAAVLKDGKCGYVDKTGKVVIPLIYDAAESFSDGLARVRKDKKWYFIDKKGKTIIGPLNYDKVYDFKDGFAKVSVGVMEGVGLIDKTGKEIVPPIYRAIGDFHEGLAYVEDWYYIKTGVIDTTGKVVIPLIYDGIGNFSGGVTYATRNSKYGLIDKTGKVIVPFKYGNIEDFSHGLARVIDTTDPNNHKHGYMDRTGKFIVPLSHNLYEFWFSEGLAAVGIKDKVTDKYKVGFVDPKGKVVIKPKYGLMTMGPFHVFKDGFAIVSDSNHWSNAKFGIIDKTGKEILPIIYDQIGDSVRLNPIFNDGLAIVRKDGKAGAVDKTGRIVIPLIFDWIEEFNNGVAVASKDGKRCIIETPIKNATPTSSKIIVNGKEVAFEAYVINGNNYFKLRDLAMVVSGTNKEFEVVWDNSRRAINLVSGKAYTVAGGELAKGDGKNKIGLVNTSKIYKDGEEVLLTAYTINNNNYFKLRDIAKAFNVGVTWDGKTNTVGIDTSIGYTAP